MDVWHIVLGAAAIGLGVAAAWLFLQRQRLTTDLAHAQNTLEAAAGAARAEAQADLARAEEALASARRETEAMLGQMRERLDDAQRERADAQSRFEESSLRVRQLAEQLAQMRERIESAELLRQEMIRNEQRLKETFDALSKAALKSNSDEFLKLAETKIKTQNELGQAELDKRKAAVEQLVKPISETLARTDQKIVEFEKKMLADQSRLGEHLRQVVESSAALRDETGRLTRALSRPEIRGRYGEIQLKRVAELAGMTSYCDFTEQTSVRDASGDLLRPDMVVRLPNERVIAVDAKTNTYAYVEAVNAQTEEERERHLERFVGHIADQVGKLARKGYWKEFDGSPEFVVMFVPGDVFIDAALSRRPELLDDAAQKGVILASPATLIGLLRAVAVGWRESRIQEQARELFRLGKELHERATNALGHAAKLGETIGRAVTQYNQFVGSVETRLMPTIRKFEDVGASGGQPVKELESVSIMPRQVSSLPPGSSPENNAPPDPHRG
ncbi:MAG: DNA recombination protein RmuC [Phycisphaeraceae bacterium]|nr:DNA recombination protein RmuC [Phycisphaeraceae bacterium]MCW5753787.1 DNA recombination protein RmuC [Phycisphaeraceae bacterium]